MGLNLVYMNIKGGLWLHLERGECRKIGRMEEEKQNFDRPKEIQSIFIHIKNEIYNGEILLSRIYPQ